MAGSLRVAWVALAALLLSALPAVGQLQFGDLSSNLNGSLSAGYTGDYGNQISSSHGWGVGGSGTLSGSYYNPNFVSFNVSPYLDQSRANSNYQSISDASGVNVSTSIFSGSHFPGAISYAKAYNSEGNYSVPGAANFVTHGNSDTFGINWSEALPDAPSLSAGFNMGSSQYSIYGAGDEGTSSFRSFHVNSGYRLFGFGLGAYYSTGESSSQAPELANILQETEIHSDNSAYGLNLGHAIPLHGSFSANINRSDVSSNFLGENYSGTIDTINTSAGVQPTNKLHLGVTADYSDNLTGQLFQSVIAAGGVVQGLNTNQESHSMDFLGNVSYSFLPNLQTSGFGERRVQYFLGTNYGANSYGGSASYGHGLFGGTFNGSVGLSENTADNRPGNTLGFSATTNYSRRILGWRVTGHFSYAQNVQTLLITYMNSSYNYGGSVARRWGKLSFGAGAGGGRTGLTEQPGVASSSADYNANVGYSHWITLSGSYTRSSGTGLQTGAGIAPVPPLVPSPILPSSLLLLYGGSGYSFGLGSSPAKRLSLGAGYSKANSNIVNDGFSSQNHNDQFNAFAQYQFRKMYFNCGFARLEQGFSAATTPPAVISSFYVGVSRWFNFF